MIGTIAFSTLFKIHAFILLVVLIFYSDRTLHSECRNPEIFALLTAILRTYSSKT